MTVRLLGNSRAAQVFEQIGIQMDAVAADLPKIERLPRGPAPTPLDIMRLMDRLNVASGSPYRNLPAEEAAE